MYTTFIGILVFSSVNRLYTNNRVLLHIVIGKRGGCYWVGFDVAQTSQPSIVCRKRSRDYGGSIEFCWCWRTCRLVSLAGGWIVEMALCPTGHRFCLLAATLPSRCCVQPNSRWDCEKGKTDNNKKKKIARWNGRCHHFPESFQPWRWSRLNKSAGFPLLAGLVRDAITSAHLALFSLLQRDENQTPLLYLSYRPSSYNGPLISICF